VTSRRPPMSPPTPESQLDAILDVMEDPTSHPRPAWADRMRAEREARHWSQATAVRALRAHAKGNLPSEATLIRNWRRWEAGTTRPDDFYAPLIAATFGTVTDAFFPRNRPDRDYELVAATGMDTFEIVSRLRASDISATTVDALRLTVDRLCSEYPYLPPAELQAETRAWLNRTTNLLEGKVNLSQHREIFVFAGWLALLLGCVEYDLGHRNPAEVARQAALSLGQEAGHSDIIGWSAKMTAWFAVTEGNFRGAIASAESAQRLTSGRGVAVQLAAQRAKAWARIGDRRQVEVALNQGRTILENLEHPTNLDNHFVVDPDKFDFYAMDCYRLIGEDRLASLYANEVIRSSTAPDGTLRKPMRAAEARITLGIAAARSGDLDTAVDEGHKAFEGERHSVPTLVSVGGELAQVLRDRYPTEPQTHEYFDRLRAITSS
jgi:hypothetical protein